jgi:transcriptional regulator with XRE-family HTH domain
LKHFKTPGQRIAEARRAVPLTLRKAEGVTGISNAYICQIETGKIKRPAAHLLLLLSIAYNVPVKEMLVWFYPELRGAL